MKEAEVIELITKKRNELEERRSSNSSSVLLRALEAEIRNLESSLTGDSDAPQAEEKQVFLDECAG